MSRRRRRRATGLLAAVAGALVVPGQQVAAGAFPATTGLSVQASASATILGTPCRAFAASTYWHARVDRLPVHPRSAQWLAHMSPSRTLHPDFGPSYGEQSVPYGIPITVSSPGDPKVSVAFDYDDESDAGPYPLTDSTGIEGGWESDGDRHAIVVDPASCTLYETWATYRSGSGPGAHWTAGSGAIWSLGSAVLRPAGWTSADAAGLPILPGLLRLEEVQAGAVDHAIRFTTNVTDRRYVWPARHQAGSVNDQTYPPMGARFRLRADYPVAGLRADTRTVLAAMKAYGLVLADNGSPWYFQGQAVDGWAPQMLDELKDVPASAFEAVQTSSLMVTADSQAVAGAHKGWRTPSPAPRGQRPTAPR